jgi:hypothetical protein
MIGDWPPILPRTAQTTCVSTARANLGLADQAIERRIVIEPDRIHGGSHCEQALGDAWAAEAVYGYLETPSVN